jgi:hypothetical protein
MISKASENKIAFMTCVEVVLMRRGNANYNLVLAKLQSYYDTSIFECIDHPEYLRDILKQVYKDDYNSILTEIRMESEILDDIDDLKNKFFKVMSS